MAWWEALLLVGGGLLAGTINAVAGGGSILTVPLLVLAGVPGNHANGSNRVGILTSNAAAAVSFRRLGVRGLRARAPDPGACRRWRDRRLVHDRPPDRRRLRAVLRVSGLPVGDPVAAQTEGARRRRAVESDGDRCGLHGDRSLRRRGAGRDRARAPRGADSCRLRPRSRQQHQGGRQPEHHGRGPTDLHRPRQVDWIPALVLAAGFTVGGWLGAHAAVKGGERFLRWAMVAAAVLLAGRLLGLYG